MVPHRAPLAQNKSDRTVAKEGVVVYIHPEGRFAVVELEFPGGPWQRAARLRETYWMEQIRRVAAEGLPSSTAAAAPSPVGEG